MYNMFGKLFRPLKEGFKGVTRHSAMSISSALSVTITLIIISLFMVFSVNVKQFTKGLEQSVQIAVMIDYDYEAAEQEDAIGLAIKNIPGVKDVTYSSKEDEFQFYLDSFEDEKTKEAFKPFEDDNPMRDAFYVDVEDGSMLESISNSISSIEGVDAVNFGGSSAVMLMSAMRTVRTGGFIIAVALSILTIFLIQNTIKLTIYARADEIAIMRNVGAKNGFIRSPFVIEGMLIGALGSIIPILCTVYGYRYFYEATGGYVISKMFPLMPCDPFVKEVSLAVLLTGILVGLIGSYFSVTKYLRWRR